MGNKFWWGSDAFSAHSPCKPVLIFCRWILTSGRKGSDSLGIYANTVDRPSAPKPKKKTAKADTDDAVMQNRKARYQLQRAAQGLLPQERVAHCQRSTMSASGVAVYRSNNGASFGNLTTCGSVWHCPICAAKITEGRRQELQGAINAWAASGGTVYLMSLTFPHQINQLLKNNLSLFSGALTKFKQSKLYRNVMAAVGSAGSIRSMEVTHGVHGCPCRSERSGSAEHLDRGAKKADREKAESGSGNRIRKRRLQNNSQTGVQRTLRNGIHGHRLAGHDSRISKKRTYKFDSLSG